MSNSGSQPLAASRVDSEAANGPVVNATAALSSVVRVGNIGLWQWEPEQDVCTWTPELYRMLRLPEGSGVEPTSRFQDAVIDEDKHLLDGILIDLTTRGSYAPLTLRLRGGDGTIRHLVSCGQRAPAIQGQSSFVGINIDVTEQAEQKSKLDAAEALAAKHRRVIESVLENVPIGLAVNVNDEISLLSRFATEMISVPHGGGREWDEWQIYHTDGKTPARTEEMALHRAARGEVIRNEEWYIRRADGALLPVSCNAGPVHDDAGAVIGGVVAWYDISKFRASEAAEREARLVAEEAVRQREVFAAAIAHELRTPLSAIHGWTEVLSRTSTPVMQARGINAISTNTAALTRLVDDFLDLARIGANTLNIVKRPCDLGVCVESALETIRPTADTASIVIEYRGPKGGPALLGDPQRIQQAMTNLLTNAVKFSAEGGLLLVGLEEEGGEAVFSVADYGQGIEPDDLPHLFKPFFQSIKGTSRRSGLGLGLTIAKHIAEKHGGSLEGHSSGLGYGATFKLRLPLI